MQIIRDGRVELGTEEEKRSAWLKMAAAMLLFGTIGVFRRWIPVSSAVLVFFRGIIGSISIYIYMRLTGSCGLRQIERKKTFALCLNGVFLGVNWIFLFEAFNRTTIAKATLCYYFQPTIVLILSSVLFHERMTVKKMICALVSFLGIILVSGVIPKGSSGIHDLSGILFGIGAACFYALVVILNKKIENVDGFSRTFIQLSSAALLLIPYLFAANEFERLALDGKSMALIITVGILHTGLAYVLYFGSMHYIKVQTVAALSYLDPITAMFASAFVLKEPLTALGVVGAIMILGASVISETNATIRMRPKQN